MKNKITIEEAEIALAEVIDTLYLLYKADFCDWENKTHKLGWFKEQVKAGYSIKLQMIQQSRKEK